MNEKEWIKKLKEEGFNNLFIWTDKPHEYYMPHKHNQLSAHVIIEGGMTVKTKRKGKMVLKEGDRFDVLSGEAHEVWIGKDGCKYIVGRKY